MVLVETLGELLRAAQTILSLPLTRGQMKCSLDAI